MDRDSMKKRLSQAIYELDLLEPKIPFEKHSYEMDDQEQRAYNTYCEILSECNYLECALGY